MIKVGEHITLDIIGTTKEYDPSVYEKVINKIAFLFWLVIPSGFFMIAFWFGILNGGQ